MKSNSLTIYRTLDGGALIQIGKMNPEQDIAELEQDYTDQDTRLGQGNTITKFSRRAQNNFRQTLAITKFSEHTYQRVFFLPQFVQPTEGPKVIKRLREWMKRLYPDVLAFYVLEFTCVDSAHYHFLIDFKKPVPENFGTQLSDRWNMLAKNSYHGPFPRLDSAQSVGAYGWYMSKCGRQKIVPEWVKKLPRFCGKFGKRETNKKIELRASVSDQYRVRSCVADIFQGANLRPGYVESVRQSANKMLLRPSAIPEFIDKLQDIFPGKNLEFN